MPLFKGEVGPHLTQCGLDRSLPPYQVASWSIQPFGHNKLRAENCGGGLCPIKGGRAGSPSNRMWPGPKPICMPSLILIHQTVWPQYTNVTNRTRQTGEDRQTERQTERSDSIQQTILQTVAQKHTKFGKKCYCFWRTTEARWQVKWWSVIK